MEQGSTPVIDSRLDALERKVCLFDDRIRGTGKKVNSFHLQPPKSHLAELRSRIGELENLEENLGDSVEMLRRSIAGCEARVTASSRKLAAEKAERLQVPTLWLPP